MIRGGERGKEEDDGWKVKKRAVGKWDEREREREKGSVMDACEGGRARCVYWCHGK